MGMGAAVCVYLENADSVPAAFQSSGYKFHKVGGHRGGGHHSSRQANIRGADANTRYAPLPVKCFAQHRWTQLPGVGGRDGSRVVK